MNRAEQETPQEPRNDRLLIPSSGPIIGLAEIVAGYWPYGEKIGQFMQPEVQFPSKVNEIVRLVVTLGIPENLATALVFVVSLGLLAHGGYSVKRAVFHQQVG